MKQHFKVDKTGYYFLKENKALISLANTGKAVEVVYVAESQEMEPEEKKLEIKFNENLYAIIQKMVILCK